jgi:hypothetical protein
MALTSRHRGANSSAIDNGQSGDWHSTGRTWHDRRKTARLYRNWDTLRPSGHLPGSGRRSEIAADGLSEYCVFGRFEGPDQEPTVESIGDYFGARLNAAPGEYIEDLYPASVLVGKFMQLGAALRAKPHPHFDDGSFATPDSRRVLYRLVILPLAEDARSVDHWMTLGSWRMDPDWDEATLTS